MWVGSASNVFSERRFRDRVRFISLLFGVGYAVIILRLFQIQIVKGEDFALLSESNRTQVLFLRAPRGNFIDRNGEILITNRPSWSLMYSPDQNLKMPQEEVERRLKPFLEPFSVHWRKRLAKAYSSKQMVRLVEDVPNHVAFGMRELGELLPGARMQMEFRRGYPGDFAASHLVGYLGEIDDKELQEEVWADRRRGDLIGKMGLEKTLDGYIRGEDGGMVIEVDSAGRLKRVIRELPSQNGNSVLLTMDYKVQQVAELALSQTETHRGAAVVLDVKTGGILAWVSSPPFNPESLKDDITDRNLPLFDRVYKAVYPPGSLFKIITAITGFEKGVIRTGETVNCIGYVVLKDKTQQEKKYKCWKKHGVVNYWSAMAESCDSYFYLLGQKVGSQAIYETARQFGLGESVQKILPGEKVGNIPHPLWKRKRGAGGWSTGDTYNMSIGQGYVTATPLQMAQMMAAMANHGEIHQMYVVERIVDINGNTVMKGGGGVGRTVLLKDSTWRAVQESLRLVVGRGTGKVADIKYLDVWAKTGTAQNPHGEDHAWFGAYAGYKGESPSIALCVFIENGGHGGATAGPIARQIIETALPDRTPKPAVPEQT